MALNLPNFLGHGPKDTAYGNILKHSNLASQNAYAPQMDQQAAQKEQLMNAFQSMKNQYAPKRFEQEEEQLRLANMFKQAEERYAPQYARNKVDKDAGPLGRDYLDLEMIKQRSGENSPEYQQAVQRIIQKYSPKEEAVDKDQRSADQARAGFEVLNEVEQPYVGTGSTFDLIKDGFSYLFDKNPELFEKLTNSALSYKLNPEKSSLALRSNFVKSPTLHDKRGQEDAMTKGWPTLGNFLTGFLPNEVIREADKRLSENLEKSYEAQGQTGKKPVVKDQNPLVQLLNNSNNNKQKGKRPGYSLHPVHSDEDLIATANEERKTIKEVLKKLKEDGYG
jgi:hypothetical protein